jgi:hypothetical protein
MPMTFDTSRAPLFIATVTGILSDDEYAVQLAKWTQHVIVPDKPHAFVYDGTGIAKLTRSQRQLQSDWINTHRAALKRLLRGVAFALDSPFTRGLLRAVHWLAPSCYPYAVFATRDAAIDWCVRQLATARFGDRFRLLRRELAGKQSVLVAEGLRCTDAAISLWETGQRLPSARMLESAIGVFERLGATSEDLARLELAWRAEQVDRESHRLPAIECDE